jgi:hypothetical protein
MKWGFKVAIVGIGLILLIALRFYSLSDIANESIRLHLQLLGSSIYEFHEKTGHWPMRAEDLAETSLAVRSPSWKVMLDSGTNVVVWRNDLKANPAENGNLVLAYHNRGLLALLGRQWVCWGDLRTEYIPSRELRARLRAH